MTLDQSDIEQYAGAAADFGFKSDVAQAALYKDPLGSAARAAALWKQFVGTHLQGEWRATIVCSARLGFQHKTEGFGGSELERDVAMQGCISETLRKDGKVALALDTPAAQAAFQQVLAKVYFEAQAITPTPEKSYAWAWWLAGGIALAGLGAVAWYQGWLPKGLPARKPNPALPAARVRQLREGLFSVDGDSTRFHGWYVPGEKWNGWDMPLMTEATVRKVASSVGLSVTKTPGGELLVQMWPEVPLDMGDDQTYQKVEQYTHGSRRLYLLGGWCFILEAGQGRTRRPNPAPKKASRKAELCGQVPTSQIDWLVGRMNVGTPDDEVRADIEACAPKAGACPQLVKLCGDRAIKAHHRNIKLYNDVMGGRIG